ncbi:hypothetical protein R3P38DRAFT_3327567 [Favolaschia claudopus]|uniref:DUF6589 domain-containing protein n=1 Tax=Favolaschia claudopus TaxID=2862362 RepID=A0AAW0A562_9AGAR
MRNMARVVASTGLYAASYDNINMVFRAAEQILGKTDSQENGTCSTHLAFDMRIKDLNAAFHAAAPLSIHDILLSAAELQLMDKCIQHCILRIIVDHGGSKFQRFRAALDAALPPSPSLPAWNIDESTIVGNEEVVNAVHDELEGGYSGFGWGVWMPGLFHGKIADMPATLVAPALRSVSIPRDL